MNPEFAYLTGSSRYERTGNRTAHCNNTAALIVAIVREDGYHEILGINMSSRDKTPLGDPSGRTEGSYTSWLALVVSDGAKRIQAEVQEAFPGAFSSGNHYELVYCHHL